MNSNYSSKKIIVTGVSGFIGQHLVPYLLNNNYEIIAIARDRNKASCFEWFKDVEFLALDIEKGIGDLEIERGAGVIHLAWKGLPNYKSLFHFEENLPSSYSFLKSLIKKGVHQILVTGTCFEYGNRSGAIKSSAPCFPNNPYGHAKDMLRQHLVFLQQEHAFNFQWARLFYMYGPGQNAQSLMSQLDRAIDNNDSLFNMSGGEQLRDYLPVEEVAKQLCELYQSKREGIFNICSGKPISVRRLVEERIKERHASMTLNLGYYPYPDYEPMAFWGERDIGETRYLPILPNAPLHSPDQNQNLAPVRLRYNPRLDFA